MAPVLLLVGLERLTALSGSLLLNLEAPFTAALAVLVFREHLGRRAWLAGGAIVAGATVLGAGAGSIGGDAWGVVLVAGACAAWGIDNNLTQRLTLKDPLAIVRVKALGAAAVNLFIALVPRNADWPAGWVVAGSVWLSVARRSVSTTIEWASVRPSSAPVRSTRPWWIDRPPPTWWALTITSDAGSTFPT